MSALSGAEGSPVGAGSRSTIASSTSSTPCPVFAGLYPANAEDYELLRDALEKLQLNDAALSYQQESSVALGPGFRAGFLGLLHMDIVQERLEREYEVDLLATSPNVEYEVLRTNGQEMEVDSPADLPDPSEIEEIREPWMKVTIIVPTEHVGAVMELAQGKRAALADMSYLDPTRAMLRYDMPLSEVIVDFYDQLKSRSQGYASLDYELEGYRPAEVVLLEILVAGQPVDALSTIVHRERAQQAGRALVSKLRELIPRQQFDVPLQAAVGGKVISREAVKALRKNVIAKCYGGDITRKRKLLEKQKAGKRRMKMVGQVEIPQEAFLAVLRTREEPS